MTRRWRGAQADRGPDRQQAENVVQFCARHWLADSGGDVVVQWRNVVWTVEHFNARGGCRVIFRTNLTGQALDFAVRAAEYFGARAIFLEDVYK